MKYFWNDVVIPIAAVIVIATGMIWGMYSYQRESDTPCETKGGTVVKTPYGTYCAKLEIIK